MTLLVAAGCQGEIEPDPQQNGPSGAGSTMVGTAGSTVLAGSSSTGGSSAVGAGGNGVAGGMTGVPSAGAGGGAPPQADCRQPTPPRAPLRRITRFEFNNTVRDLLGVTSRPADSLPGEEEGSGFGNDADALGVSRLLIDGYRTVAQQVAQQVTTDAAAVTRVAGCDAATTGEDACQQKFLTDYLARAFRRPPEAEEITSYQSTFAQGKMLGGGFAGGVRAVVERSLQSAQFLYRIEVGEPVDAARNLGRPTAFELATRLSYLLWSSMPDKALLDAAAQGKLATKEGVLSEARRMLEDPRAKDSLRYFHGMLLGTRGLDNLERDTQLYPAFKPGMGALFRQETERFLDHVVWEAGGDLATILTAPFTFVNGPLATFYGIAGVTGDAFQKVNLDTTRRSGLLTQASILTLTTPGSRTDPVVRGKWFYTKILCGLVPDPPADVPMLPEPEPGQSVRERLAQHRADPACAGCHQLMDPIGFGFENYDGVGLWRDQENGAPVDNSGAVPIGDVAGPFNGAVEFAQKLGQSRDVRACYAGRYLNYAYGRALNTGDVCSQNAAGEAFEQAKGNVKELIAAITQTDGFLLRALAAPNP